MIIVWQKGYLTLLHPERPNFIVNFTFLGAVGSIPAQKQEYDQTATLT